MPSAAHPGNRTAIEAALPPDALRGLRALCAVLDVPPDRWQHVPAIARPFQAAAVAALAQRYETEGVAMKTAVLRAAVELGLNPDTGRSWLERWCREARLHYAPDKLDRCA